MGKLVESMNGDASLLDADFIAKFPKSLALTQEWLTESEVLCRTKKGAFFAYRVTGPSGDRELPRHVYAFNDAKDALRWFDERVALLRKAIA